MDTLSYVRANGRVLVGYVCRECREWRGMGWKYGPIISSHIIYVFFRY